MVILQSGRHGMMEILKLIQQSTDIESVPDNIVECPELSLHY